MSVEQIDKDAAKRFEDVVERVAVAIAKVWYGPDFDPFSAPEYYDMAKQCARAAIAAMGSADSLMALIEGCPARHSMHGCPIAARAVALRARSAS